MSIKLNTINDTIDLETVNLLVKDTESFSAEEQREIQKALKDMGFQLGFQSSNGIINLNLVATNPGDSVVIRTKKQKDSLQRIKQIAEKRRSNWENPSKHYINNFHESIDEIIPDLTNLEAGVLLTLILHMQLDSEGYLIFESDYMTKEDIDVTLGLDPTVSLKILKKFRDLKILEWKRTKLTRIATKSDAKKGIKKGEAISYSGNIYWFNKEFHWMGKFNENQMLMKFTKLYKKEAEKCFENLSMESKGLLYKILTKVHFQTYYIALKPDQDLRVDRTLSFEANMKSKTLKDISHLSRSGLCDLLKLSDKSVRRYIKELESANILAPFGRGKSEKYMVNPAIFGRHDSESETLTYRDVLIYQFEQLKKSHKK